MASHFHGGSNPFTHFIEVDTTGRTVVQISEHFDDEKIAARATVARPIWDLIAPVVQNHFNERLREKKFASGRFPKRGIVKVDRLLGKELIVLAYALAPDGLSHECIRKAVDAWLRMSPTDRWWLSNQASSDANWRRALPIAMAGYASVGETA